MIPIANKIEIAKTEKYDLVIVGAGSAGIPCAIEAAQRGLKVLVIEKTNEIGGTLHLTGGHLSGGGTKHQAEHQITDSPEAHYAEVMGISKQTANPELVKLATQEAPKTIDWLTDLGFEFAPDSPRLVYGHVPYQIARTQYGKEAGKSILKILKPIFEKLVTDKKITVLLETSLVEIKGDKNKVTGLVIKANDSDLKETIIAKNYVLTTGGYAANAKMFAAKHQDLPRLINTARESSQGEGITLAENIGAKFWNADKHIASLGGVEVVANSGKADFWNDWAMVFTTHYRPCREIYVNAMGFRFMNEASNDPDYRERAVSKQLGAKFWVIFDATNLFSANQLLMYKWTVEKFYAECQKGKCAWYANSIVDLAQKTGLPPNILQKTIDEYNAMTKEGIDYDYKRPKESLVPIENPTYFAVLTYATSLISFGGLAINEKLQVLNQDNKPIKSFYAAGEIIGAGATTGNAFAGGMLLTPALSFGRILGKTLS